MTNGKWTIEVVRSVMPGHMTGWLLHKATGTRYVFSVRDGGVSYMKEPKPPTNIPRYIDSFLLGIRDQLLKP